MTPYMSDSCKKQYCICDQNVVSKPQQSIIHVCCNHLNSGTAKTHSDSVPDTAYLKVEVSTVVGVESAEYIVRIRAGVCKAMTSESNNHVVRGDVSVLPQT